MTKKHIKLTKIKVELWRSLQWLASQIERIQYDRQIYDDANRKLSPIFVIGPPRSGSTLLTQVLVDAFDCSYLTNQHCRWFGAPALAERMLKPLDSKIPSTYQSQHGRTEQPSDPAECGAWWYRFFRRDPAYVTLNDVKRQKMRAFVRSIQTLETQMRRPLVFKNLYASLRIEPIAHYIPNALFVVLERDPVDNAQSILKGRKDALGSYEPWWSVPPPNVDQLKNLSPVQQSVEQIRSVHSLINRDIQRLGLESQIIRVNYEAFCQDSHSTLERIKNFAQEKGVILEPRFEVPERFPISNSQKIPDSMYQELLNYTEQTAPHTTQEIVGGYSG